MTVSHGECIRKVFNSTLKRTAEAHKDRKHGKAKDRGDHGIRELGKVGSTMSSLSICNNK